MRMTRSDKRHAKKRAASEAAAIAAGVADWDGLNRNAPDPEPIRFDANVSRDGQCLVPASGGADRADTGAPCDDGRAWPEKEH